MLDKVKGIGPGLRLETLDEKLTKGPISLLDLSKPRDFSPYYEEYKELVEAGEFDDAFHIVNQDETILNVLNSLSGEYPNAVMIGDPGIGKSLTLEFIVDVITGKIPMNKVKGWIPESIPLFESVVSKLEKFENREYLSVPNLYDPMNVEPFSFTDKAGLENNKEVLDNFFGSVDGYLNGFSQQRRESLTRRVKSMQDYKSLIYDKIHDTMIDFVNEFTDDIKVALRRSKSKGFNEIPHIIAKIDGNKFKSINSRLEDSLNINLEFLKRNGGRKHTLGFLKHFGGFNPSANRVSREEIEDGIAKRHLTNKVANSLDEILNELAYIEIDSGKKKEELSELERAKIFRNIFNSYMTKFSKIYEDNAPDQANNLDIINNIVHNRLGLNKNVYPDLSLGVLSEIKDGLNKISGEFSSQTSDLRVLEYMKRVTNYLSAEEVITPAIEAFAMDIENIEKEHNIAASRNRKKGKNQTIIIRDDSESTGLSGDELEYKNALKNVKLEIEHGDKKYKLEDLLKVKELASNNRSPGSLREVTINGFGDSTICTISEDSKEDSTPYHMRVSRLGPFFDGGILVFRDNFGAFVNYVVKGEDKTKTNSNLELMLEFLQTGKMTVEKDNVRYTFNAPKMILGAGNEYPFIVAEDGMLRHISGLEDRIGITVVKKFGKESKEGIINSIRVLENALNEYNEENGTELKLGDDLRNYLISTLVPTKGVLDLKYRLHRKRISKFCSDARSRGVELLDLNFLRKEGLEFLSPTYFLDIDHDFKNVNGIVFRDDSRVGAINGLGVSTYCKDTNVNSADFEEMNLDFLYEEDPKKLAEMSHEIFRGWGSRIGLLSVLERGSVLPNSREDRFVNVDRNFTDALPNEQNYMTQKSHLNAASWILDQIANSGKHGKKVLKKKDWRVKTQFEESWQVGDGPSASGATAVTILSALFDEPIRTNRFMTGSFTDGEIGAIGGGYIKASVPYRFSQLYKEHGVDKPMYFLFPTSNLGDMRKGLEIDLLGFNDSISMIPVSRVEQAYALSTIDRNVLTVDDLRTSFERGKDLISDGIQKFNQNILNL